MRLKAVVSYIIELNEGIILNLLTNNFLYCSCRTFRGSYNQSVSTAL